MVVQENLMRNLSPNIVCDPGSLRTIVLAGGCFWGVEAYFARISGVITTQCGYANGHMPNPTYEEVCSGTTGHAEAVCVEYDQDMLKLEVVLGEYFGIIDPTSLNSQGNDRGEQYRTGVFFSHAEDEATILAALASEQRKYSEPIVTQVEALRCFYPAEVYHQQYLEKNPGGYCHVDLSKLSKRRETP